MVCAGPLVSSTPLQRPFVRLFVSPPLQETQRGIYPRRVCPGRVKCLAQMCRCKYPSAESGQP